MGKIAWGLTGAAHLLEESLSVIATIESVELFSSRAALEVLSLYKLKAPVEPIKDSSASALACRGFYSGRYEMLIIAPATSNSVAKFVCGISDSLISTLFAQAGKAGVPIVVLPTDAEKSIDTMGATKPLTVTPRPIDLENVEKLKSFPKVTVVKTIAELKEAIT